MAPNYTAPIPRSVAATASASDVRPGHPETATTLHNLACLYCDQRRYEEAEPLYKRALYISEQALG